MAYVFLEKIRFGKMELFGLCRSSSVLFIRNVSILSSIKSKYIFKVAQQADFQIFALALQKFKPLF